DASCGIGRMPPSYGHSREPGRALPSARGRPGPVGAAGEAALRDGTGATCGNILTPDIVRKDEPDRTRPHDSQEMTWLTSPTPFPDSAPMTRCVWWSPSRTGSTR